MRNVDINIDTEMFDDKLITKIENLLEDKEVTRAVHSRLLDYCTPYVPMLEGPLSQTAIVEDDGVTWVQPYAHYQYIGISPTGKEFDYTKTFHPLATREWDKAMMRDRGDDFLEAVADIIKRKIHE